MNAIKLDNDTWLRAKAWALWKATFELCQIKNKNSDDAVIQKNIIEDILTPQVKTTGIPEESLLSQALWTLGAHIEVKEIQGQPVYTVVGPMCLHMLR